MQTILVPLDGSPFGEHALPLALDIARRGGLGLALAHVHHIVVPSVSPAGATFFDPGLDVAARDAEADYLAAVAGRVAALWDGPVTQTVLDAPIAEALCRHAAPAHAGLIALSTHGRGGVARAWLGSVADRVVRQSPVPVLVVRPSDEPPDLGRAPELGHVLVPLDGSFLAEEAIDLATQIGQLYQARYTLVRIVEPITRGFLVDGARTAVDVDAEEEAWHEATEYLKGVAARLRARGLHITADVRIGKPAAEILDLARAYGVSLIAMSTHGRGGVARLLVGSVADKVLRGATVPVLLYRPREPHA